MQTVVFKEDFPCGNVLYLTKGAIISEVPDQNHTTDIDQK